MDPAAAPSNNPNPWIWNKLTIREKWVDNIAIGGLVGFGVLMFITWAMLLDFAVRGHREIAIATEHQDTCDHVYLEGDAGRARLFEYLTTSETVDSQSRMRLINNVMKMALTIYIGAFALGAFVIWHAAGPTYLCAGTNNFTKTMRCVLYLLGVFIIFSWLTAAAGMSSVDDKNNKQRRFFYPIFDNFMSYSKLERIDADGMGRMSVHVWSGLIALVSFAAAYQMSCGFWQVRYLFLLCATAAACLAATAYFGPRLFNAAVYDYSKLKGEFKAAYEALSTAEQKLVCDAARRNMLLGTGRNFAADECAANVDKLFGLTEHMKGAEFANERGDVSPAMVALRDVMSKARRTTKGVELMRKWSAAVMAISIFIFIGVCYPLFMQFMRMDHMVLNYGGISSVMAGFVILVVVTVSVAWMTNALVSTGSGVPAL